MGSEWFWVGEYVEIQRRMAGSENMWAPQLLPYSLACVSLHLAIYVYLLRAVVIYQSSNESTGFLSSRSHQSKLTEPKEGVMGTSDL